MSSTHITDFTQFFSILSKSRKPSATGAMIPIMSLPGMISLAGGLPNSETFPFSSIKVDLTNETSFEVKGKELIDGLQYHPCQGLPSLIQFMRGYQQEIHNLPMDESKSLWDVTCTTGSQDGLTKAFDMLLNPYPIGSEGESSSEGMEVIRDAIIIERPTYTGSLSTLSYLNPLMIQVDVDAHGIIPEQMEESIIQFKSEHPKAMIKFLYTIPNGQNPSGCSQTLERKKKIYAISQKYNFLILEDDPYYYMNLYDINDKEMTLNRERIPSYLSLDIDDRVLRFDSFSKILSSGVRLGFVTGPLKLIQQIVLHTQLSNLHSCGLSQAIICSLLNQWGREGLLAHIQMIQKFYTKKRNDLMEAINNHLGELVEYNIPSCGMFIWLKLRNIKDTLEFIEQKAREYKVLLLPGTYFYPTPNSTTSYVRASFSTATREQMDEACKRLAFLLLKQDTINH